MADKRLTALDSNVSIICEGNEFPVDELFQFIGWVDADCPLEHADYIAARANLLRMGIHGDRHEMRVMLLAVTPGPFDLNEDQVDLLLRDFLDCFSGVVIHVDSNWFYQFRTSNVPAQKVRLPLASSTHAQNCIGQRKPRYCPTQILRLGRVDFAVPKKCILHPCGKMGGSESHILA